MNSTRARSTRALSGVAALAFSLGGAVGALLVTAGPAAAGTTTVTNTADDGSSTSLRGVLESANDGDVVVLTAGATYQLTICAPPGPDAAEGSPGWGDVEISGAVTIVGNGATIEQTCDDRVLYTQDALTLQAVTVTGGTTGGPGGGLFSDSGNAVVLTGATFAGNESTSGGGGVAAGGNVTVTNSTFTDNHARGGSGDGGGLQVLTDLATVTITGSTFSANTADGWGGAFEQESFSGVDGAATPSGTFELTVTDSSITGNTAEDLGGGGLDTEDPATVTVNNSTVSGNTGGLGGGVGTFGTGTKFAANGSTFSGNTADVEGGAVMISDDADLSAAITVPPNAATFVNSTITGNTEGSTGAVTVIGALSLLHVTMTHNTSLGIEPATKAAAAAGRDEVSAAAFDGDAANLVAFDLTSADSVVAQPAGAANCAGPDGAVAHDAGFNFSDDDSCAFASPTSKVKTPNDPVLGALASNGGPTATLLPLAGSPLLDAIPPAVCGAAVDQRGITRPQGTGCDIGAVEVVVPPVAAPAAAAVVTPKFTG